MLNDIEFSNWGLENKIPESTLKYINANAREAPPARLVGGVNLGL